MVMVETKGEVEVEDEIENKALETRSGAAFMKGNTCGRIVHAIEMVHATMVVVVKVETKLDNMISNNSSHTTLSSSSIFICLLLQWLNIKIYHLRPYHW